MDSAASEHVRYLAVEGVIGVGKTSLVHRLAAERGGTRFLEMVEENPFLTGGFYKDMERYAFDTEMFFLLARFRQQRRLVETLEVGEGPILSDYRFDKNRIFARLTLSGRDYAIWERLFEALAPETPEPDLTVYLKADTDVLMDRIRARNRPFEREITRDYVERLNRAYDRHFEAWEGGRLLAVDVSELDFVGSDADYAAVTAWIDHKTAAIEAGQRELDLASGGAR
ncbi:MAG: deoxynucleoside kinase [Gemmatimonadetes bacterium]|nr:deoxynucleoside kinase [Gemmatimonadota bacterium]